MILGNPKRQINDRLDQSIQVTNKVLLVMADNRHIIVAGFWDKSFRIYSTDNAKLEQGLCHNQRSEMPGPARSVVRFFRLIVGRIPAEDDSLKIDLNFL